MDLKFDWKPLKLSLIISLMSYNKVQNPGAFFIIPVLVHVLWLNSTRLTDIESCTVVIQHST